MVTITIENRLFDVESGIVTPHLTEESQFEFSHLQVATVRQLLNQIGDCHKIAVIKVIRGLTGLSLLGAKTLYEVADSPIPIPPAQNPF